MSSVTGVVDTESAEPRRNVLVRLYRGETSFDFVGRRRWWFVISAIVIVAGIASLATKGLNFGIDFKGGTSWEVPDHGASVASVQSSVQKAGLTESTVQVLGQGSNAKVQVQADLNNLSQARQQQIKQSVQNAMAEIGRIPATQVNVQDVGPTWGSQISNKAIIAVIVFFAVVVIYISLRFEWKMAIAALIAVMHDLLVVIGIYSLSGFQVTSDTVIAVLTILGYSLYDTVVVFDRVADNTKGLGASGRMTYEDVVNLSMNQTLARSINTSLVAILPVLSVLVIGAQVLGATTLQYFGLALVIGLASGAYSSIFIASPVLCMMKERESRYANIRQKLASRADRTGLLTPRAAAMLAVAGGPGGRGGGRGGRGGVTGGTGGGGRAGASKAASKSARTRPGAPSRRGGVIRPGAASAAKQAAKQAGAAARTIVGEPDESEEELDEMEELDELETNGAGDGQVAREAKQRAGSGNRAKASAGGTRGSAGGAGAGASGASQPRRPAPRPRKGKGGRKGRRR